MQHEVLAAVKAWFDADGSLPALLPGGLWIEATDGNVRGAYAILEVGEAPLSRDSEVAIEPVAFELQVFCPSFDEACRIRDLFTRGLESATEDVEALIDVEGAAVMGIEIGAPGAAKEGGQRLFRAWAPVTVTAHRPRSDT